MRILSDFLRSYKKNEQKCCFMRCFPHENFWKLTGMGSWFVIKDWQSRGAPWWPILFKMSGLFIAQQLLQD